MGVFYDMVLAQKKGAPEKPDTGSAASEEGLTRVKVGLSQKTLARLDVLVPLIRRRREQQVTETVRGLGISFKNYKDPHKIRSRNDLIALAVQEFLDRETEKF